MLDGDVAACVGHNDLELFASEGLLTWNCSHRTLGSVVPENLSKHSANLIYHSRLFNVNETGCSQSSSTYYCLQVEIIKYS